MLQKPREKQCNISKIKYKLPLKKNIISFEFQTIECLIKSDQANN
jgi:hypothetical protein